ncbi:MAG: FtsW/RodA/SpoVE family cell cycle protein [Akkermansia sp.]|nr:FtsW/RodA/SpoVE family cell cycle protein [Akkermansia sp.]
MTSRVSIICIWVCFILLLILGLIMVASTGSCVPGQAEKAWYSTFLGKQCIFAGVGLVLAFGFAKVDYRYWRHFVKWIWIICVLLLALCFVPGIGLNINGESRWIKLGLTFQPSELAKITLMLTLANWYTTYREMAGTFWKGFVFPGAILFGLPLFLILIEKDMGTAAALAVSGFCVMYVSGTRTWLLLLAMLLGAMVLYLMMTSSPNRMLRIEAWRDPQAFSQGAGCQQWRAILAFARGGLGGVGLGDGIEKYGSLPYAHTDFIFAEIGEEWGFFGSVGVVILFTLMTLSGFALAVQTQDTFGRILALGLSCTIFCPAMLNIAVVTSLLPNTGLPLPFISSGGTNLVFTIASIGLLTSIQRHTPIIRQNYWPARRLKEIQNP